jgi:putative transposase
MEQLTLFMPSQKTVNKDDILLPVTAIVPIVRSIDSLSVKGLKPYWDTQSEVINSKLWLPIKTALQDERHKLRNDVSDLTLEKSWFTNTFIYPQNKSSPPVFSAIFPSKCTEETTKAKFVKLYPTRKQKRTFNKWHDCSRYTFNQTIDYIRSCVNFSPSWMEIKKDLLKRLPQWCLDVPFQIKGIAVKEAHQAFWKAGGHPKFRSRKTPTQSCYIPKSAIFDTGIYPRVAGIGLRLCESLPESPLDSRLIYQYNEWFLSVPHKTITHVAENQGRVVALDPREYGHFNLFIQRVSPDTLVTMILGVSNGFVFIWMI